MGARVFSAESTSNTGGLGWARREKIEVNPSYILENIQVEESTLSGWIPPGPTGVSVWRCGNVNGFAEMFLTCIVRGRVVWYDAQAL